MTEDEKFDKARAELDELMKHLLTEKRVRVSDRKIIANANRNESQGKDPEYRNKVKEGCKQRGNTVWIINHAKAMNSPDRRLHHSQMMSRENHPGFKGYLIGTDVMTNLVIYKFAGNKEIRAAGLAPSGISQCISGKVKSYKGCVWHREPVTK